MATGPFANVLASAAASGATRPDGTTKPDCSSVTMAAAPHASVQITGVPTASDSLTSIPQPSNRLGNTAQSASDKTAGSLLLALAGVLLIAVAVRKSRKASLIIGGIGTWLGITAFIGAITSDNENPTAYAILMILASVGIGFLALKRAQAITNAIQQRP